MNQQFPESGQQGDQNSVTTSSGICIESGRKMKNSGHSASGSNSSSCPFGGRDFYTPILVTCDGIIGFFAIVGDKTKTTKSGHKFN